MSEMEQLERQLHGWVPRRPSLRVEQRLFGTARRKPESSGQAAWLTWLAPVTAGLMMCIFFNQRNASTVNGTGSTSPTVAMILSNQSAPPLLRGETLASNTSGESFEWTNGGGFTSSISSFSGSRGTN